MDESKIRECALHYLTLRSNRIIDDDIDGFIAFLDDDGMALASIACDDEGNPMPYKDIVNHVPGVKEFEAAMMKLLTSDNAIYCENKSIRYDVVSITVIAEGRALIKHFMNYQEAFHNEGSDVA